MHDASQPPMAAPSLARMVLDITIVAPART
jgi:hypothetical protein